MQYVKYEQKNHYAIMTIDRPEALNALNSQVIGEIGETIENINLEEVRCLIITGAGSKSFVAGADIAEMANLTPRTGEKFGREGSAVFRNIARLPIPVIAAVNGFALGGGCELSLCCDIRIASENARFGQPEVTLGITPGFGGTQRLARIIGTGKAKEMLFTGKTIDAHEAHRLLLVNGVYAPDELMPAAEKLAATIAANAPIAVQNTKCAINEGKQVDIDSALTIEARYFGACFETDDQIEGMKAFLEHRRHEAFENK